ncbi:hypothetical protein D3C86_1376210 [compost metagenome]
MLSWYDQRLELSREEVTQEQVSQTFVSTTQAADDIHLFFTDQRLDAIAHVLTIEVEGRDRLLLETFHHFGSDVLRGPVSDLCPGLVVDGVAFGLGDLEQR